MDRLPRPFFACGLGLILAATGCKATRPEVPPGRPFANNGQQRKAIEFSSDGHPLSAGATTNFMPTDPAGGNLASGIGSRGNRPDGSAFGAPPGAYGPPGTSGLAQPGTADPASSRASSPPAEMPPGSLPAMEAPPAAAPETEVPTPRGDRPAPNPIILPPSDKPGAMGVPDQMPSPM